MRIGVSCYCPLHVNKFYHIFTKCKNEVKRVSPSTKVDVLIPFSLPSGVCLLNVRPTELKWKFKSRFLRTLTLFPLRKPIHTVLYWKGYNFTILLNGILYSKLLLIIRKLYYTKKFFFWPKDCITDLCLGLNNLSILYITTPCPLLWCGVGGTVILVFGHRPRSLGVYVLSPITVHPLFFCHP